MTFRYSDRQGPGAPTWLPVILSSHFFPPVIFISLLFSNSKILDLHFIKKMNHNFNFHANVWGFYCSEYIVRRSEIPPKDNLEGPGNQNVTDFVLTFLSNGNIHLPFVFPIPRLPKNSIWLKAMPSVDSMIKCSIMMLSPSCPTSVFQINKLHLLYHLTCAGGPLLRVPQGQNQEIIREYHAMISWFCIGERTFA